MIPADGTQLKLGKGSLLLRPFGSTGGFVPVGNATAITMSADQTVAEKFSSTQNSAPLIARAAVRTGFTLACTLDEYKLDTLKYFLLGTENDLAQASATNVEINYTNVEVGKFYLIERAANVIARRVTNVTIHKGSVLLVENEDYKLYTYQGGFTPLAGGPGAVADGDDLELEYDAPAITQKQLRGSQQASPEVEVLYLSDDANVSGKASKDTLRVWRASIGPEGELPLISEEFGSFQLTLGVLSDVNHPGNEYFELVRDPT